MYDSLLARLDDAEKERNRAIIRAQEAERRVTELEKAAKEQLIPLRPWRVMEDDAVDANGDYIFSVYNEDDNHMPPPRAELVAQHIVECVNAAHKKEDQ